MDGAESNDGEDFFAAFANRKDVARPTNTTVEPEDRLPREVSGPPWPQVPASISAGLQFRPRELRAHKVLYIHAFRIPRPQDKDTHKIHVHETHAREIEAREVHAL